MITLVTSFQSNGMIFVKYGHLIEQDPHDELVSARGAYWDMVPHKPLDLVNDEAVEPVE